MACPSFMFSSGCSSQWLLRMVKEPTSKTARKRQQLSGLIKQFWLESGGVYGYRKIHCYLKDVGESCGINRVHRLMKANGLKSQRGYRKPRAHAGNPAIVAANTLDRQFNPTYPNQIWVTDISVPQQAA